MAEDPDAVVERVEDDAVGAALHVNGFDLLRRFGVPHRDRLAAGEAVSDSGIHGRAARLGFRDIAGGCKSIQVVDGDARRHTAARNVKAASVEVRVDVIEAPIAADLDGFQDPIRPGRRSLSNTDRSQHRDPDACEEKSSHMSSPFFPRA